MYDFSWGKFDDIDLNTRFKRFRTAGSYHKTLTLDVVSNNTVSRKNRILWNAHLIAYDFCGVNLVVFEVSTAILAERTEIYCFL